MKNIKTLLLTCALSALAFTGFAQEMKVGHVKGSSFVVDDKKTIINQWETELKEQDIDAELTNIEIRQGTDGKTPYYMLFASNKKNTVRMAGLLQLSNDEFFLLLAPNGTSESVVCVRDEDCESGCAPTRMGGKWICDAGCISAECTKTTTVRQ